MGTFGIRLRDSMIAHGVTVASLARRCDVTPKTVRSWVAMERAKLTGENLALISEFMNVRMRWLAVGRGEVMRLPEVPEAVVE